MKPQLFYSSWHPISLICPVYKLLPFPIKPPLVVPIYTHAHTHTYLHTDTCTHTHRHRLTLTRVPTCAHTHTHTAVLRLRRLQRWRRSPCCPQPMAVSSVARTGRSCAGTGGPAAKAGSESSGRLPAEAASSDGWPAAAPPRAPPLSVSCRWQGQRHTYDNAVAILRPTRLNWVFVKCLFWHLHFWDIVLDNYFKQSEN